MTRPRSITGTTRIPLDAGWTCAATAPGAFADAAGLAAGAGALRWFTAPVPGTAATALRGAGEWTLGDARDFDAEDWWWQCTFKTPAAEGLAGAPAGRRVLRLEGLATIAEVFLNGAPLATHENMFRALELDVTDRLRPAAGEPNELAIVCRALAPRLAVPRKPRARWKTRLTPDATLRFYRTTLLGRMPGWNPPAAAVGPWRPVTLETRDGLALGETRVQTRLDGADGIVELSIAVAPGLAVAAASITVGGARGALTVSPTADGGARLHGVLRLPRVARWWPHTHGAPARHVAVVHALVAGGAQHAIDLGRLGFRTIAVDRGADGDGFGLVVNDVPIFARGAVWTTADLAALDAPAPHLRALLDTARCAGMNILRVGGTMVPESDTFYELCDELGILVWQDLPFANFDYPAADPVWRAGALAETEELLDRLATRASLAVICGSSEVEQQAAMLGLPRAAWRGDLFDEALPAIVTARRPDVPYLPSTPTGGPLPFHVDRGVSHYYGVGAYRRPLDDARRAAALFVAECLGFSNVPEERTVALVPEGAWRARVPRDRGADWDFEDVRDHYLASLFGVDPAALRASDPARWRALGRVVTGELMAAVFGEWRRAGSPCRGGIVWTFQDLWPGAGYGLVDSMGLPKAACHMLARVLAPVALFATDEGLNGVRWQLANDGAAPIDARLAVQLLRHGETAIAAGAVDVVVPARGVLPVDTDALLEGFRDPAYAYRFGPPEHDVVVARLTTRAGDRLADTAFFPVGFPAAREADLGLTATARPVGSTDGDGAWLLSVSTRRFAYACAIDVPGFRADDDYLHVAPGAPRLLRLVPDSAAPPSRPFAGQVAPTNAATSTPITVED